MMKGRPSAGRLLTGFLTVLTLALSVALVGYLVLTNVPIERINSVPISMPVLFAVLAMVVFLLAVLVIDRIWDLYRTQQQKLSGGRMHRRLALLLSTVALLPAAVAFSFTGAVISFLADEVVVDRLDRSTEVARNLANTYADTVGRQMGYNLLLAERDLVRARAQGVAPQQAPIGYRRLLVGLSEIYQFEGLTHLDAEGRIIARVFPGMPVQPLPPALQFQTRTGDAIARVGFGAVDPETLRVYFAVIPVSQGTDGYLIGYRTETPNIANELVALRDFRDDNRSLKARLGQVLSLATLGFILMSMALVLGAVWVGLLVSNAVVGPIRRLATAAEKVSAGDLESRVEVRQRDGELADLGHTFNVMTERLAIQRQDLIEAGQEAEDRRNFIETMLGVIPAGVISVSQSGDIGLANPSAASILGEPPDKLVGRNIKDVIPQIGRLFNMATHTGRGGRESLEWARGGEVSSLIVEISPETLHGADAAGFVVTIENITELVTAQRTAAWADVARRIAHEIKNPLTPIQLSAERLRRRYASELEGRDREIFDQCTSTIVKNVGDIGRMVTEFSSFARMPEPIISEADLGDIAREALFPFGVAYPAVTFVSHLPHEPVRVMCDSRLIAQALTNLIKNAAEAISEADDQIAGRVEIEVIRERAGARVEVRDNGKGLPSNLKHRLTEPYMTTREKGTGLGLAIVRKAIEDHDGSFEIRDRDGAGAVASLFLPALPSTPLQGDNKITDNASAPEEPALHGH